jgi:DNA-binding Lrp family transcriptional regulator
MPKPLHYPLTELEWLNAWNELKPAEIKILFYLRTLNPWGDRQVEVKVVEIADRLNMNKSTVSRALKRLDELGYIDFEAVVALVSLKTKAFPVDNEFPVGNKVSCRQQERSFDQQNRSNDQPERSVGNNRPLEALQEEGSGTPHTLKTLKTNSDFLLNAQAEQTNTNTSDEQEESEPLDSSDRTEPNPVHSSSVNPKPTGQGNCSAATAKPVEKTEIHPTERCDRQFSEPPWGFYSNPDPGFLEFLSKGNLKYVDPYKNYPKITAYHARKWLNKAKRDEERYEEALIEWDAYQDELKESAEIEQIRQLAEIIPISPILIPVENSRESLIARLTAKAKLPGQRDRAKAEAIANGIPLEAIGLSGEAAS